MERVLQQHPRTTARERNFAELSRSFSEQRISKRVSQLVDEPVPQKLEEIVERVRWISATADRRVIMDVLIPQITEENVEVVENVFQEWISERIREQIVAVLVCFGSGTKCASSSLPEVSQSVSCLTVMCYGTNRQGDNPTQAVSHLISSPTTTPTPLTGIRLNPCATPLWSRPSGRRADSKHRL